MATRRTTRIRWVLLLVMVCVIGLSSSLAQDTRERLIVSPDGEFTTIDAALAVANIGDVVEVRGGVYPAPLIIEKSVSLIGTDEPVIDGQGTGSLVLINAPDTQFEGFTVRNSGTNLNHEDTGIVIQAPRVTVENNVVENVLFGIYFANAEAGIARSNSVMCMERELGLRGDGMRVWFSQHVTLLDNIVTGCRDTLIWYAEDITIENNVFQDSRYGLHFMYSSHAVVIGNTFSGNSVGSYLMYSQHLTMTDNQMTWNRGPSGYGIALKDMDYVTLEGNVLVGNRAGLYIDNSPALYNINNFVIGNFFAYNHIGITALPSTERNIFQANTFLENNQQISVQGRGNLLGNSWQYDGVGNYWSDYVGYDGGADGIGDTPYRAEKLFESLADRTPVLRFFTFSPASQAIDFAASAFPSLRPDPKVIDDAPLMQYSMLTNIVQTSQNGSPSFLVLTLILLVIGVGIWVVSLRGRQTHRNASMHSRRKIQASA